MKSFTIALATAKETIRQPAFFVMAVFAGALLIGTIFVPYFTFGEDIKMYKDTGLTTISFACMLLSLLTASSTVAEEIEGKTAITLLSKPINRRQFIIGKFLGIELVVRRPQRSTLVPFTLRSSRPAGPVPLVRTALVRP